MSFKFYFNCAVLRVTITFKFLSEFKIPEVVYMAETCISIQDGKRMLFFGSFLLCFHNFLDLIFKLKLGYFAIRCNLFIYMNRMWIEKNQDKSSCTAYNQITPRLYIYAGSDSNQWFSFTAFQDVFAPSCPVIVSSPWK